MKVDVSEIISNKNKEMSVDVTLGLSSFDAGMGAFPVLRKAPFALSVANVEHKQLKIIGRTEVTVGISCSRCLAQVPVSFPIEISKEIDLVKFLSEDVEELEDADYMTGTDLDVDALIFGEILVSWPMKVLCREDCKGICKHCGTNLNLSECQCQKSEPDPRMAAIQDIFNQFKEV